MPETERYQYTNNRTQTITYKGKEWATLTKPNFGKKTQILGELIILIKYSTWCTVLEKTQKGIFNLQF